MNLSIHQHEGGGGKPLAVDLYCGLGGWTEGLLAEGWAVIGFDIEQHAYDGERYPGLLVIQDVRTLHGSQFKDADLIVGSSPCQEFSYRAMPWKRAKALGPPELGMELFRAQFRIQREASEAAGRHIPMVVENVRGAQPWVGRAAWNYGSYYLWGDVPALMPPVVGGRKVPGFRFDGSGGSFQTASVETHLEGRKNTGGSWFNIGSPGQKETARNPVHDHVKNPGRRTAPGSGARFTSIEPAEGRKGAGAGAAWFDQNLCSLPSGSSRRKAASAKIAKIPEALSRHIGRVFLPRIPSPANRGRAA